MAATPQIAPVSVPKLAASGGPVVARGTQPLMLSGAVLVAMAAFPGLPTLPFLVLGSGIGFAGWKLRQKLAAENASSPAAALPAKENLEALLKVEPLAVEVGLGLVRLVEGAQKSPLLKRISGIRRQLDNDLGYLVPPVRVTDYNEHNSNLNLAPAKIRDIVDRVTRCVGSADSPMALVTSSAARYFLRQMIEGTIPNLATISHNEISPGARVVSLGLVK